MIIQEVPNLSCSIAKRNAKNVSCIGIKISPPSESGSKNSLCLVDATYRERKIDAAHRLKSL